MTFHDHFSAVSGSYAAFRPSYPEALLERLAALAPARRCAWDCATGSGQAARGLARFFEAVVGTDASPQQLAQAAAQPEPASSPAAGRLAWAVARAEAAPLRSRSVDLVTVAQAVHWFDLDRFWEEVRRVGVPGGAVAVWCYVRFTIDAGPLDRRLNAFYDDTVGPFWPAERSAVEDGYRDLPFPFDETPVPGLQLERPMTLEELGGYLRTWSSTQRYTAHHGRDPVPELLAAIAPDWGDPARSRPVHWPLHVRAGRLPAAGGRACRLPPSTGRGGTASR